MGIYLPGIGTLDYVVWSGAMIVGSQGIPPNFYLPHINVGPPILRLPVTLSPLLLPIWTNVASLNPWLLVFHTA